MAHRSIKINTHYQITIPAATRRQLNLHPGDRLIADVQDGMIFLIPKPEGKDPVQQMAGLHREVWAGIDAQEYVHRERKTWGSSSE